MSVICPTITAKNSHDYRKQLERVTKFANRIHLDFADEEFTSVKLLDLDQAWRPEGATVDIHLMFNNPAEKLTDAIKLHPNLVIMQAESDGNFRAVASRLKEAGIKVGIAILPQSSVAVITPALAVIDHVLIFSGHLGHYGGRANLSLLGKISEIKEIKPEIEIGWDGGINDQNVRTLAVNGVDVLNVGSFIQRATDPEAAYQQLTDIVS